MHRFIGMEPTMHQMPREEIFIVDDEPSICELLSTVFLRDGYRASSFIDGGAFLIAARHRVPAFVLLDVNMPGRSGLDVLLELNAKSYPAPIIVMSGYSDIPTAVEAMRRGAIDFIEKPFEIEGVPARLRQMVQRNGSARASESGALSARFPGYDMLTPREREVLAQVTSAASNKEAGRILGISPRTVEVHRARIMHKLGAKNTADLVRMVLCEGR
jgi:FixJ family two-component response regulator